MTDIRDIEADRLTAHATRIALDAQALAADALRVRDQHATTIDALRAELADLQRRTGALAWAYEERGKLIFELEAASLLDREAAPGPYTVGVDEFPSHETRDAAVLQWARRGGLHMWFVESVDGSMCLVGGEASARKICDALNEVDRLRAMVTELEAKIEAELAPEREELNQERLRAHDSIAAYARLATVLEDMAPHGDENVVACLRQRADGKGIDVEATIIALCARVNAGAFDADAVPPLTEERRTALRKAVAKLEAASSTLSVDGVVVATAPATTPVVDPITRMLDHRDPGEFVVTRRDRFGRRFVSRVGGWTTSLGDARRWVEEDHAEADKPRRSRVVRAADVPAMIAAELADPPAPAGEQPVLGLLDEALP